MAYSRHKNGKTIQGLIHVDDTLIASKIHCASCLEKGVKMLWPENLGIEIEHRPPILDFLHIRIELLDCIVECPVNFTPLFKNEDFARGNTEYQKIASVVPFTPGFTEPREVLRPYVSARFAGFVQVYAFHLDDVESELAKVIAEILRLGWSPKQLANVMFTVGMKHRNHFKKLFIMTATMLKNHCYDLQCPKTSFLELEHKISVLKEKLLDTHLLPDPSNATA